MKENRTNISRRSFIKSAGAAGLGSALAPLVGRQHRPGSHTAHAAETTASPRGLSAVPASRSPSYPGGHVRHPLQPDHAQTGHSLGRHLLGHGPCLQRRTQRGGHRPVLQAYPDHREKIFLVTKSTSRSQPGHEQDLATSLKRMNTDHIDLFFVHAIRDADTMDSGMREWAAEQKAEGRIRLFGFSTHSNMEQCLLDAARLDWIDGIMMTYNFRLMHEEKMKAAVKACVDAGIGLTAMKTQGGGAVGTGTSRELELAGRFVKKGLPTNRPSSRRCGRTRRFRPSAPRCPPCPSSWPTSPQPWIAPR
jgi:hypothetical protein